MRSLSYAGGDFVCPGAATGSQIGWGQKSENALTKTIHFFWLSISYVSVYLMLSHVANPCPVTVKCDSCAYNVDVT